MENTKKDTKGETAATQMQDRRRSTGTTPGFKLTPRRIEGFARSALARGSPLPIGQQLQSRHFAMWRCLVVGHPRRCGSTRWQVSRRLLVARCEWRSPSCRFQLCLRWRRSHFAVGLPEEADAEDVHLIPARNRWRLSTCCWPELTNSQAGACACFGPNPSSNVHFVAVVTGISGCGKAAFVSGLTTPLRQSAPRLSSSEWTSSLTSSSSPDFSWHLLHFPFSILPLLLIPLAFFFILCDCFSLVATQRVQGLEVTPSYCDFCPRFSQP
mmetsp:Transcript_24493/g.53266  ORF Transcript_24493/g.53266 Transcript_24493/m.53266 type:complete len:269 (-) Transcript_24493:53-859(-)